jgi:SAM-dependent methyltransferase
MSDTYIHGYKPEENERLHDQASTLSDLLHVGTCFPAGSRILEAGCGVGAQTVLLGTRSPEANFVSIDVSADSLIQASRRVRCAGLKNVEFVQADILSLPFEENSFDHAFVCFVLEHIPRPERALIALKRLIRPGGTITVIEGDHGSVCFHPDSVLARAVIDCQVELQRRHGGNALIGRQLYPLLKRAAFDEIRVEPRLVYVDQSRPDWIDGFTERTFIAMIRGVREAAIEAELIDSERFDLGVNDLLNATKSDGVFLYTFFKGVGVKP